MARIEPEDFTKLVDNERKTRAAVFLPVYYKPSVA